MCVYDMYSMYEKLPFFGDFNDISLEARKSSLGSGEHVD